jgi:4-amino-4-deoxy-L-arabinose transferase-like glycosyltransferase
VKWPRGRSATVALAVIALWAAALRLWRCESALPGLHVDEAANVWNAWCLLRTGHDEWGTRWPVFYTRALDDYRSPLFLYGLLPFQALGGMNVCTSRLPAALGGAVTVLLVFYLGKRLFNATTGAVAAALLAVCPWHIQYSRWAHESSITPLLFAGACAALLAAGAPCVDAPHRPRAWRGLLAGMVAGVACYGYASVRIVLPATLVVALLATLGSWRGLLRAPAGRATLLAMLGGMLLIIGPLLWVHVRDPLISHRSRLTVTWDPGDDLAQRVQKVLSRYPPHFGTTFLFRQGSADPAFSPPQGYGWLNWYVAPLLVGGIGALVWRARASLSARLLLVMLACYPAADLVHGVGITPHQLRAYCGVIPLMLTAAFGATTAMQWIHRRSRRGWVAATSGLLVWGILSHVIHLNRFFGQSFNDDAGKYWQRNMDMKDACEWLRPRLHDADAVFITSDMITAPHETAMVFLNYDPHRWFAEPRRYIPPPDSLQAELVCAQVGKIRFLYTEQQVSELTQLAGNGRRDRVLLVLRPRQAWIAPDHAKPARVLGNNGVPWLLLYELEL